MRRNGKVLIGIMLFGLVLAPVAGWTATCGVPVPYSTIQLALNDPLCGTVVVASGTYYENLAIGRNVLLTTSAGAVIDGNQNGSVVTFLPGSEAATLDGFTIQNGGGVNAVAGGGIQISYGPPYLGNQVISNCIIQDNSADWGGGIFATNYLNPTIRNCTVRRNTARSMWGGGIVTGATTGVVEGCKIKGNSAVGSSGGYGGGLCVLGSATVRVINSIISGNYAALGGGGVFLPASAAGYAKFINSTIAGNQANGAGGGAVYQTPPSYSNPREWMVNSIVWGNSAPQLAVDGPNFQVNYSDIGGGWPGPNINKDPKFLLNVPSPAPTTGGDCHIRIASPCRGAGGTPLYPDANPSNDIDGNTRPMPNGTHVDIGADEVN